MFLKKVRNTFCFLETKNVSATCCLCVQTGKHSEQQCLPVCKAFDVDYFGVEDYFGIKINSLATVLRL